jgi:Superfamily II helicase
MNNLIYSIKNEENIENILKDCIEYLYKNGTTDRSCLEKLSYIKLYHPLFFQKYESSVLIKMGLFYKQVEPQAMEDIIFQLYKEEIHAEEKTFFTPVQAQIIQKIRTHKVFSFSSPTSTGKSHIFRFLIKNNKNDSVVIVPSRALINEYYRVINDIFKEDKTINILTFVDIINTSKAKRNVFIITPERTSELFNLKEKLHIGLILFDEAQLSNDKSVRGLYYDSVIRRVYKNFTEIKMVFAYPFISNPEMQFQRNNITIDSKESASYNQKNVGQIFYSFNEQGFYHFGISKNIFGNKVKVEFDPLRRIIENGGTALIYCSKSKIYNGQIFNEFKNYILLCKKRTEQEAINLIENFRVLIGASDKSEGDYRSQMVEFLKQGIVVHHGSLPLAARTILEEFTRKGFCQLCFATSTLDQGINMPFDLVWIDYFKPSNPLSVKNLIGRAGRSTEQPIFDYGQIVIKDTSKTQLRKIVENEILLDTESQLDINIDPNDDYKEYKEAIKQDKFSEKYNLTDGELNRIQNEDSEKYIKKIIELLFDKNTNIREISYELDEEIYKDILDNFSYLYEIYLNRRLTEPEKFIINTALKIMLWRIKGHKFSQIVWYRYSYAARTKERNELMKKSKTSFEISYCKSLPAKPITQFNQIPNKNIIPLSLTYKQRAIDVDYDRVMVDTYDYMDKLLGFRLGDMYYAAFAKYGEKYTNEEAIKLSKYIKYGTIDEKSIWLLRYGFDFEDFDWLYEKVKFIDETGIKFNENINELTYEQINKIEKYI